MLIPVILSGGAGTRLWPLSRELYPKQFLPLVGERTMIQETALRSAGLPDVAAPIVVCNEAHRFLVAEQLRQVGVNAAGDAARTGRAQHGAGGRGRGARGAGRDAKSARRREPTLLLVLPADHVLADTAAFRRAVELRCPPRARALVTFGVVPTHAETGYGYIRAAAATGPVRPVAAFVEKPDAAKRAPQFVASGDYLWNSGMFLLPAPGYLDELERLDPAMLAACRQGLRGRGARPRLHPPRSAAFEACRVRFDRLRGDGKDRSRGRRAARCRLERRRVLGFAAGRACRHDAAGNVTHGDVLTEDSTDCLLLFDRPAGRHRRARWLTW